MLQQYCQDMSSYSPSARSSQWSVVSMFQMCSFDCLRKRCNLQFSSWRSGKLMLRALTATAIQTSGWWLWLDVTGCDWNRSLKTQQGLNVISQGTATTFASLSWKSWSRKMPSTRWFWEREILRGSFCVGPRCSKHVIYLYPYNIIYILYMYISVACVSDFCHCVAA